MTRTEMIATLEALVPTMTSRDEDFLDYRNPRFAIKKVLQALKAEAELDFQEKARQRRYGMSMPSKTIAPASGEQE